MPDLVINTPDSTTGLVQEWSVVNGHVRSSIVYIGAGMPLYNGNDIVIYDNVIFPHQSPTSPVVSCGECHLELNGGAGVLVQPDFDIPAIPLHQSCANYHLFYCAYCRETRSIGWDRREVFLYGEDFPSGVICGNCAARETFECDRCYRTFFNSAESLDATYPNRSCIACNNIVEFDSEDEDETAFHMRGDSLINDYSYKPRALFHYGNGIVSRRFDSAEGVLFMGAEIELEMRDNYSHLITDCARTAVEMVGSQAYLKHDGSLSNGFEVVTHPATFEWWKEDNNSVLLALKTLAKQCKSYHSSNCGMHIHMSKAAFTSFHLMRFLHFIYNNQQFVEFISQRRSTGYAAFSNQEKLNIIKNAKAKYSGYGRFVAVNLENADTIELRVFKGNLDSFRILKNIEFAHALYSYTKLGSEGHEGDFDSLRDGDELGISVFTKDLTPRAFKTWAANNSDYDNLNQFLSAWKGR